MPIDVILTYAISAPDEQGKPYNGTSVQFLKTFYNFEMLPLVHNLDSHLLLLSIDAGPFLLIDRNRRIFRYLMLVKTCRKLAKMVLALV